MKKTLVTASTVLLIALTGACGGDDGRPTTEEISKSLTADDSVIPIPEDYADCFAQALVDSDLSDKTLTAIKEQDADYQGSDSDRETLNDLSSTLTEECVGE